jgi:hypothetical protein
LGEMFQYDYELYIRFLLKCFKLHDVAQRESVEFCITLDDAELCKGLSHLMAGVKITDPRAIDPRDEVPISCMNGVFGRYLRCKAGTTALQ